MISYNSSPAAQAAFSRLLQGVVNGGRPRSGDSVVPIADETDTSPVITLNPTESQFGKRHGRSGLRIKFSNSQFSMHAPIHIAPRGFAQTIYTMLVKHKDVPFRVAPPISGGEYDVLAWDKGFCSLHSVIARLFAFMPECSSHLIGLLNVMHTEYSGPSRDFVSGIVRNSFLVPELEAQGFRVMNSHATKAGVVVTIGWIPEQMRGDNSVVYGVGRFLFVNGQFFRWLTGPGVGDNSIVSRLLRRVLSKVAQPLSADGEQHFSSFEQRNGKVMGTKATLTHRFEQYVLGSGLFADGQDTELATIARPQFYPSWSIEEVESLIGRLRYEIGRELPR